MRIHELAKELGMEWKAVLDKTQKLGFEGKKSHSSSLTKEEADQIRHALLRDVVSVSDSSSSEKLSGDRVERRTGNVIRRRKANDVDVARIEAVVPKDMPEEVIDEVVFENHTNDEVSVDEPEQTEESEIQEEQQPEVVVEAPVEEVVELYPVSDGVAPVVEGARGAGPRVLGRMILPVAPVKKAEVVKKKPQFSNVAKPATVEDDDKKQKKGKRREFNRADLLDYEGSSNSRTPRHQRHGKKEKRIQDDSDKSVTKASKRVVEMQAEMITVGDLAAQMSLKAGDVIKKLFTLGVMATINQAIDQDTATIIAEEFGFTVEHTGFDEEVALQQIQDDPSQLKPRAPVVTIMGHVDHGKTSLLDRIRKSTVAAKEHGGITQHIGAYEVEIPNKGKITFIDTPGHAAFTSMRARGANVTDIVILVVAADDGVMPQTIEALNHAKAAGVSIVVAVNKMDKRDANPDRVKQQLADHGIQPEEWGGDTIFAPVSAATGDGIEHLLESILLVAEVKELKANPDVKASGRIIEVRQEIGRGTVSTILIQRGTLKTGDIFVVGPEYGKIRSMANFAGQKIMEAIPSTPVEITGVSGAPAAGDEFFVVDSESVAKEIAEHRKEIIRKKEQVDLSGGPISLEEFAKQSGKATALELDIILKADVHGSVEAVKQSIEQLSRPEVSVKVLHAAVGGVTESDVQLAIASKAIIIGFGVRSDPRAEAEAENRGVEIRYYRVIYELLDDVKMAMAGLLAPVKEENSLGRVEVRNTFSIPKIGMVAGSYILDGIARRNANVRLLRDAKVVYEGKISQLKRFKDDAKEVQSGYECGISLEGYNDIKVGDIMEVFEVKEIARTLD